MIARRTAPRTPRAMREIVPRGVRAPFGAYAHGVEVPAGWRLVATSGQLGIDVGDAVPRDIEAQARICFRSAGLILAEAGMTPRDVVRVSGYLTDRAHFPAYMAVRDAWLAGTGRRPASTLLVVGGFTRPEFLVEVEILAAAP
jgi:enamine deaminase RidA (YjgF/YER057c/UK114 family)